VPGRNWFCTHKTSIENGPAKKVNALCRVFLDRINRIKKIFQVEQWPVLFDSDCLFLFQEILLILLILSNPQCFDPPPGAQTRRGKGSKRAHYVPRSAAPSSSTAAKRKPRVLTR